MRRRVSRPGPHQQCALSKPVWDRAIITWSLLLFAFLGLGIKAAFASDPLPDAAGHIGIIVINNNDEFTTNTWVNLTINAVNDGNGVALMQFSNDDANWSSPELYQTNRVWQLLDDGIYPTNLNTVLRTVYVRFQDGLGNWSKAVSDSIVFAKRALDVPNIQEVWISQQLPINYDPTQPLGAAQNPYLVPAGTNEVQFDSVMYHLVTNYNNYWPQSLGTNQPPPATNCTVLTLHIGPGVYETHGDNPNHGVSLCWAPRNGWRIFGAGKDVTTLKAVGLAQGFYYRVNVVGGYGNFKNVELADLTLDANIHEGGPNMGGQFSQCIAFCGDNIQIRRVKAKNAGSHMYGAEPLTIALQNWAVDYDNWNLLVEDCEIVHPQYGNAYQPDMLAICGEYGADGKMRYFHNVVVRNNYIDGAAYNGDVPLDPTLYPASERGNQGMGIGGTWGAIIEDNLVVNVTRGYYADEAKGHNLVLRNNHFRSVFFGANPSLFYSSTKPYLLEDYLVFAGNLVELDPHYYTNGEVSGGTYGWRYSMLMNGNLKGPTNYSLARLIVTNNVFQLNDQATPDPMVTALPGTLVAFSNAIVNDNLFYGMTNCLRWDNDPESLDQQIDFVFTNRPVPLSCRNNTFGTGGVTEAFPYVLDKTLPQLTVTEGDLVSFTPPTLEDLTATIADGWPQRNALSPDGLFHWQTGPQDAGRYVVSFYDSTNRLREPRRALLRVLDRLAANDPQYFANGLTAYWRMDETLDTSFRDTSGNGLNLNIAGPVNGGYLTLGVAGPATGQKAAHMNPRTPANASLFYAPNTQSQLFGGFPLMYHPLLNQGTTLCHPVTLCLWLKPDPAPAGNQGLFSHNSAAAQLFCLMTVTTNQTAGFMFGTLDQNFVVRTPRTYALGAWHQLVIVYDGVSGQIYVDGGLAGKQQCAQLMGYSTNSMFYFGGGGGGAAYVGALANVAIWNRPLRAVEISQLHSQQLAGIRPSVVPVAPSALNAQLVGLATVVLGWQDNSMNESGFFLERSADGINFVPAGSVSSNTSSFIDNIPQPRAGAYYYRAKAVNAFGGSAYCAPASIVVPKPSPPPSMRVSGVPAG